MPQRTFATPPYHRVQETPRAPRYETLSIHQLHPSPNNTRSVRQDDPSLTELAESIKAMGLIEPVVVRPITDPQTTAVAGESYEILAGERRYRAHLVAGLDTVDCKIVEADDETAFEITVVENLQREDLHPLQEAAGVERMLTRGWDIARICDRLGKSESWVRVRARLAALDQCWRKDYDQLFANWSTAHFELIARLEPSSQIELRARFQDGWLVDRMGTAADLAKFIERELMHRLSSAPWKLDDGGLVPEAGACSDCPKRSSCQAVLFADLDGGKDRCLDAGCWNTKTEAHVARRESEMRKKHNDLLIGVEAGFTLRKKLDDGHVDLRDALTKAKKGERGARPVLVTEGKDVGKVRWLKPQSYADEVTKKAFGGTTSDGSAKTKSKQKTAAELKASLEEREERLRRARARWQIDQVLIQLVQQVNCPLAPAQLVAAVAVYGTAPRGASSWQITAPAICQEFDDADDDASLLDELRHEKPDRYDSIVDMLADQPEITKQVLWRRLRAVWISDLECEIKAHVPDAQGAKRLCTWCSWDWATIEAVSATEVPEPKSLARDRKILAEGGPKKAAVKKNKRIKPVHPRASKSKGQAKTHKNGSKRARKAKAGAA